MNLENALVLAIGTLRAAHASNTTEAADALWHMLPPSLQASNTSLKPQPRRPLEPGVEIDWA